MQNSVGGKRIVVATLLHSFTLIFENKQRKRVQTPVNNR